MTMDPANHPWSNYCHNALDHHQSLVTPHPEYTRLGATPSGRHAAYRALVREHPDEQELTDLRRHAQQQRAWGSERSREPIEAPTSRSVSGRPCKPLRDPNK